MHCKLPCAVLLCAALLTGCAAQPAKMVEAASVPPPEVLVVYTSHPQEVYEPLIAEFEQRTGIWVDVVTGGTQELLDKIADPETVPAADVLFGGGVESLAAAEEQFLPYVSLQTAALRADVPTAADGAWSPFSSSPLVLIYNTKLVGARYAPTSWASLRGSRWTGRIAFADPALSGSCYTALETVSQLYGTEYLADLAANLDGQLLASSGKVLARVADGSFSVGVALESTVRQQMADGADLNYVYPRDGTTVLPDGMAIIAGTAHMQSARLFIDCMLGADVQTYLARQLGRDPVRAGIAPVERTLKAQWMTDYSLTRGTEDKAALLADWQALCTAAWEGAV